MTFDNSDLQNAANIQIIFGGRHQSKRKLGLRGLVTKLLRRQDNGKSVKSKRKLGLRGLVT